MRLFKNGFVPPARVPSVRNSVALFGILLVIAVIGINMWSLNKSWQQTKYSAEENAVNLSLSQVRQAEDTFVQIEMTIRNIQRDHLSELSGGARGNGLSRAMRELQSRLPQLHGLFFYNAEGKWLATSANRIPSTVNNADRDYFIYHRQHDNQNIRIGAVVRSRSTGDLVIPVSVRINDAAGVFAGVLLATVNVDYFRHFYGYYELGNRDILVLMLADATVLYARSQSEGYIGNNLSSSQLFTEMLTRTDRGSGEWRSALDGKRRIFGFARSMHYPLVVAAGFDRDSLKERWLASKWPDISVNLALLGGVVLMGTFILRQAGKSYRDQLELIRLRDELTLLNRSLHVMALIDALTGLANRRQFDLFLSLSLKNSEKNSLPVSLIMLDVDYFKRYNDIYGHVEGDNCLRKIGALLKSLPFREHALAARYGGEEFAIILQNASLATAQRLAHQLLNKTRETAIPHSGTLLKEKTVTLSAGCHTVTGTPDNDADILLLTQGADRALYSAKKAGRNRVSPEY